MDEHRKSKDGTDDNPERYYQMTKSEGKIQHLCKICARCLSTKQRVLTHVSKIHNCGEIRRLKKRYLDDPSIVVPKRTQMRKRASSLPSNSTATHSCEKHSDFDDKMDEDVSEDEKSLMNENQLNIEDMSYDIIPQMENYESNPTNSNSLATPDYPVTCKSLVEDIEGNSESSDGEFNSLSEDSSSGTDEIEDSSSDDCSDDTYSDELESEVKNQTENSQLQKMCVLSYVIRHNLTAVAGEDLTGLLNLLCPLTPGTSLSYHKLLEEMTTCKSKCVHYCNSCHASFPSDDIFQCQTPGCHGLRYKGSLSVQMKCSRRPVCSFTLGDIKQQLVYIMSKENNWSSLLKTKDYINSTRATYGTDKFDIHDIIDGESYRSLCESGNFLSRRFSFSGLLNTDGIPLFSSTKEKLWPIFIAINELPVSIRFSRHNLILAGIWQGKNNPPFFQYMSAVGREIYDLFDNGFPVNNVNVKFGIIQGTFDLQAKSYVVNMSAHNGAFGCITCNEEGKSVKQGKGTARYYPHRKKHEIPSHREHDQVVADSLIATSTSREKGICGPSGLMSFPSYDIVIGTVPDYMHGVLLGATKTIMKKHFSAINSKKPYFIGKHIKHISNRLKSIKPPDSIERVPRDLEKYYLHFKATELQTWLLFYSLPCLHGILPDRYLRHLACFSEGIYLLLCDSITPADLQRAQNLLNEFYEEFAKLYGEGSCGLNIHNIGQHLVFYVRQWGPLFAWSCFGFEDANANILSFAHGTADVTNQIIRMKEMHQLIQSSHVDTETAYGRFCEKMGSRFSKRWSKLTETRDCKLAGATKTFINSELSELIRNECDIGTPSDLKKVLRIEHNSCKYYSSGYTKMKSKISYIVLFENGQIVEVEFFIHKVSTDEVFCYGTMFELVTSSFSSKLQCSHIKEVIKTTTKVVLPVSKICEKLFLLDVESGLYISRIPNMCGHGVFK